VRNLNDSTIFISQSQSLFFSGSSEKLLTKVKKYGRLQFSRWKNALVALFSYIDFASITMTFAATITVPAHTPDQAQIILDHLVQDGFDVSEIRVPEIASPIFTVVLHDARSFNDEIQTAYATAWPLRCERWLNRLSTTLTGQMFWELPIAKRRAIGHMALSLAGQPSTTN
jgi:hypothetical protein